MASHDQRPPRSSRPRNSQSSAPQQAPIDYQQPSSPPPSRPPAQPTAYSSQYKSSTSGLVSFDSAEHGDRHAALDHARQGPSAYQPQLLAADAPAAEAGGYAYASGVGRKKSLVRPEREKIEPGHRQWHYRTHAAQAQVDHAGGGRVGVLPSATGNYPATGRPVNLRRGKSLLAREEDVHESGLALFHRSRGKRAAAPQPLSSDPGHGPGSTTPTPSKRTGCMGDIPGPKDAWMIYCWVITAWIPNFLLSSCGMKTPEQRRAWREKMGLVSVIAALMAIVGYITFGFTQTVCGRPINRYHTGSIDTGSVIIHGYDYDLSKFNHPKAGATFPTDTTNPLFEGNWGAGGNDISFMFQRVNDRCAGLISKATNSPISGGSNERPPRYFPCNIFSQNGATEFNRTLYNKDQNCHLSATARGELGALRPQGQVYYTWDDVKRDGRNLAVFESSVLDLNILRALNGTEVSYPAIFDEMKTPNGTWNGKDLSMTFMRTGDRKLGHCLQDITTVGFIDTNTIGCVASKVVLYVSLVFIIGVVGIRFGMAVMFSWFFASKIGNFGNETYRQRMARMSEIENWTNDIYKPAPSQYRPNVIAPKKSSNKMSFLPNKSRYTPSSGAFGGRPTTAYGMLDAQPSSKRATVYGSKLGAPSSEVGAGSGFRNSRSSTSLTDPCPFPLINVVQQPPADYEPFGYPLAHTICLVTAYSESVEGLRTTLDSLATTDYPNSHKLILIIADGVVKGAGNSLTTPEICLSMMKDLVIPVDEVEPHSYVAIADGHKRHNMAKVYAGFYEYDDATVEVSKQQRVPIVLVAKVGNPLEVNDAKPGNRGKRDSQIVLMGFLQKVMFDERMTTFEYEFFNSIWRVTGISPDRYELVLCVDADTKVFPDSLSRMVACMVQDEEIMGLCGETKIANKAETWVTMIQVFEYYISHHMTKAFESMFGGVTCLPGCFSMYRIKAPKGDSGYWVPILANPDIVEHYSENVVDTLHKKNLLLLGEDRYLTTLMLKTFPRRKNMFCPSAVCKTIVPDTFGVLLSQRRRWINSTIHNLFELLLVRDLCGTFCFSMQFVVGMELGGTLVLPAAISFTLYLIIISIIPGGSNTTIPLILLAIVLGLPGLLIVITTRKIAYVGWMLVYLLSLPIWNGILPAYSFWHFDDFSWGQTRQIAGAKAAENHGDKEGEFDSSHIVMKRWAEFERERRWKSESRDNSIYYDYRTGSPKKADSNRYSLVSSSETFQPPSRGFDTSTSESGGMSPTSRTRDSHQVLTLPTPLSVARPPVTTTSTAISGSSGFSRSSEEGYAPPRSNSNSRLVGSQSGYDDPYEAPVAPQPVRYSPAGGYDATSPRSPPPRSRVTSPTAGYGSPTQYSSPTQQYAPPTQYASQAQYSAQSSDPAPQRPRRSQPPPASAYSSETEEPSRGRGVSLTDAGPVQQQPDAVRRVPRSRRPTSQTPQQSQQQSQQQARTLSPTGFSSASAQAYGLPPGAAPPQAQQEYRRGPPAAPQQHRGGSLPPGAAAPQRGTGAPRSYGVGRYVD